MTKNHLEKCLIRVQITALKFLTDDLIIAGMGPRLLIFHLDQPDQVLFQYNVFQSTRIHGMIVQMECENFSWILGIHGEKKVSILRISLLNDSILIDEIAYQVFDDWIKDLWIPNDLEYIAIGFAHNQVSVYDLKLLQSIIPFVQCQENCISYSGTFYGDNIENLIYAVGTVFNEIILWYIKFDQKLVPITKKFLGHEGVVFKIKFDKHSKDIRFATVSDDRSIRIWNLNDDEAINILYGHFARIWDCEFIKNDYLASISEDSNCRIWNLNTNQCISCLEGHRIKNIWSLCLNDQENILVTGGADSSIKLWNLDSIINKSISDSNMNLISLPEPFCNNSKDFIRNFTMFDLNNYLFISQTGNFFKYQPSTQKLIHFYQDEDFINYCVFNSDVHNDLAIAGSLNGNILLLDSNLNIPPAKIQLHHDKLINLFILSSTEIITNSLNGDLLLTKFNRTKNNSFNIISTHKLMDMKKFFLDAKLINQDNKQYIIVGSRIGGIDIYVIDKSQDVPDQIHPVLTINCAHNNQAVTSITGIQINSNKIEFVTSARDGNLGYWSLKWTSKNSETKNDDKVNYKKNQLQVIKHKHNFNVNFNIERYKTLKLTKGNIEKLYYVEDNLFAVTFFKTFMILYNVTKNYQLLQIDCGGYNKRSITYLPDLNITNSNFSYIRKKQLCTFERDLTFSDPFKYHQLLSPIHAREIRDVKFLPLSNDEQLKILVTASENNTFEFHSFNTDTFQLLPLLQVMKHRSVIKSLNYLKTINDKYLFTSGGRKEIYCWKINLENNNRLNCNLYSHIKSDKALNQDTRVMDISIFYEKEQIICIAVYSEAIIRIWKVLPNQFKLLNEYKSNKCFLKVKEFLFNSKRYFITTNTDGLMEIWNYQDFMSNSIKKPIISNQIHQSGINSLDIYIQSELIIIATGGDDGDICVNILDLNNQVIINKFQKLAHSSCITGIKFLSSTKIISTANDQRLIEWEIVNNNKDIVMNWIEPLDVADIGCIELDNSLVAVAGFGLEILKLNLNV